MGVPSSARQPRTYKAMAAVRTLRPSWLYPFQNMLRRYRAFEAVLRSVHKHIVALA
jgi:hypothetical protein